MNALNATQALYVLAALDTGEWEIQRCRPGDDFTDEYQREHRWWVRRQARPFCDNDGCGDWFGPTAYEAIKNAEKAIAPAKESQRLREKEQEEYRKQWEETCSCLNIENLEKST